MNIFSQKNYLLFAIICYGFAGMAQPSNDNCSGAQYLCPNNTVSVNNINATTQIGAGMADGATAAGNFCYALDNTVWFTFTTNSLGGAADVAISGITSTGGGGFDTELQGVIIEAGTPCDESTYSSVSNCEINNATGFTLSATTLLPNTTYYIQIDGDLNGVGITDAAECNFSIEVSGVAVDITETSTIVGQTCGATDGQITVSSVSGGSSPYNYSIDGVNYQASNVFSNLTAGTYTVFIQDNAGCMYAVGQEIVPLIGGVTGATITTVDASCNANDGEIHITGVVGGTSPYTYSLNGGAAQAIPDFTGLSAGTYTVTIYDAQNCPYTDATIIVLNNSGPTSGTAMVVDAACGQTDGVITISGVTGGTAPYTYALNGGPAQGSAVFSNLSSGVYSVTVTDNFGCTFVINNIVIQQTLGTLSPSVVITIVPNPACQGQSITVSATGANGGSSPNYNFIINGASVQSGAGTTYSGTFSDGDVVSVILTSNDPCVMVSTATSNTEVITVLPQVAPTIILTPSSNTICNGDVVNFTTSTTNCSSTSNFEWYVDGVLTNTETTGSFSSSSLLDGSQVSVTMNCSDACSTPATSNTETIAVTTVTANAGSDVVIGEGSSTVLNGSGGGSYSWLPSGSLDNPISSNPVASPSQTTTYLLTVTLNGCTATDEVTVVVTQLIVPPNTFTPNGDGVNDTWQIAKIRNYPTAKVNVYDRWGQKIFNSIGYDTGQEWDGTNRGLKLPAATYFYVIDIDVAGADKKNSIFTGSITIVY